MCRRGCLCGSLQWLAALALNGAVVGSLAFCLFRLQNWPVSLAGSVVYLLFLVGMTRRTHALEISRAEPPPEEPTSDDAGADDVVTGLEGTSEEPPETSSAQVGSSNRRRALPTISLGLSLWYLLTILVLAVPGAILVFCVFPCSHWNGQLVERYWKTNTSSFSEEVIQWMENPTLQNADSFCQVGETVYVYGSFENAASDLYAIQNGAVPQGLGYSGAHNLAAVSDATVCFIQDDPSLYDGAMMFCGSAAKGFRTVPKDPRTYAFSLQGIGGLLWFRQVRDDFLVISSMGYPCGSYSMRYGESPDDLCPPADTIEVLSLNVTTMDITGHSVKYASPHEPQQRESVSYDDVSYDDGDFLEDNDDEEQDDGGVEEDDAIIEERKELFCVDGMWTRWRALGGAVLSALPVIISSVRIWIKHAIPSAPIALFFGIGMGFACFSGFFDPWPALEGFFIWTTFGTPIWAIVCTYQLIVNPKVSKAPLWWSLYVILTMALAFVMLQEYAELTYNEQNEGVMWFIDVLLIHLPTLVIAILTHSKYIFSLSVLGFILLASTIVLNKTDAPSTYVYGSFAYVVIGLLSLLVYRSRQSLHDRFVRWLSACARHTCAIETEDTDETDDVNTTGLLHNDEATEA